MSPLPRHRPHQLSLGPLEAEILAIIWAKGGATVKEIHDHILADPDRDLTQASVTTVLQRLAKKGWLRRETVQREGAGKLRQVYCWQPTVSQQDARLLTAHQQLQSFLAIGSPDIVAAFADSLDVAALDKLDAIADRLRTLRDAKQEDA
ncbi:BlaI/MecI/CopY family transcriptional regulator [Nodosilinea sp. LEGE 06152]|uniref:BlaI/MecI/CopY family transcriptional regulator n=1 Tax=Nodosilinea sp. LEGE 06152 TaxID=2777966 RepID=UPI00187EBC9E|nr:BlaI/MecI/CopY family transcriptional regulator [Nodosilinea sp. LEGE 06152]MBE9159261.1 BlaI/MecI/CopY family transcriptional regulator [Nodosilinea sp. LEGE 06152]